jgi:hypothetical protein
LTNDKEISFIACKERGHMSMISAQRLQEIQRERGLADA